MLNDTLLRYQNRTLDTAQVIAELVDLAKTPPSRTAPRRRTSDSPTTSSRSTTRSGTNDAAVLELGDDTLKKIAHELLDIVRRDAKTDWAVKEQVRARLRTTIKRLLRRYHYPPDQQEAATQLVLEQAEVIAADPDNERVDE